jgi:hypothetical protein
MIVILSAAYVLESVRIEVGEIPVSFVPLANRRLYVYQIETLKKKFPERQIILTLPVNYRVTDPEIEWISRNNVQIEKIEEKLNLEGEILKVLEKLKKLEENILFIMGYCLPLEFEETPDMIAYYETDLEPQLQIQNYGSEFDLVWAGVFSISDTDLYIECLKYENNNYRALKKYSFKKKLQDILIKCYVLSNSTNYFEARSFFTTERAFNSLIVENTVLKKFSINQNKIEAEAYWYENIPNSLSKFVPKYYGEGQQEGKYFYSLEYLGIIPLNESYVFGRHTVIYWKRIFTKIQHFLLEARSVNEIIVENGAKKEALFIEKANSRLAEFEKQTSFDINIPLEINGVSVPSIKNILLEASRHIKNIIEVPAFIHGDLCLSNILYDSRMRSIKLIDPRGRDEEGYMMIFGSQIYDIAKLAHSIIGLYDHIIAGQFELSIVDNKFSFRVFFEADIEEIQNEFKQHPIMSDLQDGLIEKILPLIFISMLPLHVDSTTRQYALLANALRLYANSFAKGKI